MARRRTFEHRLRSLLGLTLKQRDSHGRVIRASIYTQKELAEILGVSTRTLRRFKNQKDYRLAPYTWERIKSPLVKEEGEARRYIRRHFKLPPFSITQFPHVYVAKQTGQRTLEFDCEHWSTDDKSTFLHEAGASGLYLAWRIKVEVPPGVSRSGDIDEGEMNEGNESFYYMRGPFAFERGGAKIDQEVAFHEDAGRIVVAIYLIEKRPT